MSDTHEQNATTTVAGRDLSDYFSTERLVSLAAAGGAGFSLYMTFSGAVKFGMHPSGSSLTTIVCGVAATVGSLVIAGVFTKKANIREVEETLAHVNANQNAPADNNAPAAKIA